MYTKTYETINTEGLIKVTDYEIVSIEENFIIVKNNKGYFGTLSLESKTAEGSIILNPIYKSIKKTANGLYIITKTTNESSLINQYSNIITYQIYDEIKPIDDIYLVTLASKYGIIDKDGSEIIKPLYDDIKKKNEDTFIVKQGNKYGLVNKKGEIVFPIIYNEFDEKTDDYILFSSGKSIGFANMEGEILFNKTLGHYSWMIYYVGNNHFLYSIKNHTVKLIDSTGKKLKNIGKYTEYKKDIEHYLNEGMFYFEGYIYNEKGDKIYDEEIRTKSKYHNGHLIFPKYHHFGLLNKKGLVLKPIYQEIEYLCGSLYCVKEIDGYRIFDTNKNEFIGQYYKMINANSEGLYYEVKHDIMNFENSCGIILANGKKLDSTFNRVLDGHKNVYRVLTNVGWRLLDADTERFISNYYHEIDQYSQGYYPVCQSSDKWGVIDGYGEEIIKPLYDEFILSVQKDFIILKHSNTYSLFDSQGNKIFDHIKCNSIHILNDNQIIIDNYLMNIEDIKIQYKVDIKTDDGYIEKEYDSQEKRDKYLNSMNLLIKNQLEEIKAENIKIVSKFTSDINDQISQLKVLREYLDNDVCDDIESRYENIISSLNYIKLTKIKKLNIKDR